ncbi:MAG: hypothetical protein LC804_11195 [Acidobacteria bacterium]|nr:hypothetical protein [Acidobacteriota bacterium]
MECLPTDGYGGLPRDPAPEGVVHRHRRGETKMRRRIAPFILAGALSIAAVAPAAAAPTIVGPIGGLVTVVAQLENVLNDVANNNQVDVLRVTISDSLNNLLQNAFQHADIDVLTNAVQNNLNNLDVDIDISDITVVGDSIVITLLSGDQIVLA